MRRTHVLAALGLSVLISCGGGSGGAGPEISTQPQDQTVHLGQTATFTVVASSASSLGYQWSRNGTDISGATSASYTTPAAAASDSGSVFRVEVRDSGGTTTSEPATLTVNLAPAILTPPQTQAVVSGRDVTFTVVASGQEPLNYQWSRDGSDIPDATAASYVLPAAATGDDRAVFRVEVTNVLGSVTSEPATLNVNPPYDDAAANFVGTWATAPFGIGAAGIPRNATINGTLTQTTLRQIVRVSIGGDRIRLRLSNRFGTRPVEIKAAHVGLSQGSMRIVDGSDRGLTFDGVSSVTIPAGEEATSDSVALAVPPLSTVAISLAFGSAVPTFTGHTDSWTYSYVIAGNRVADASFSSTLRIAHWYYLEGLDVEAPETSRAVAILGDSITDGHGSSTDGNNRWPDVLAGRLADEPATSDVAVLNLGIGGSCVLTTCVGPSALARFDRQILEQPGVRWAFIFIGVNDIGSQNATADAIIAGYQQLIDRVHDAGLLVYGATITPLATSFYDDSPNHVHMATRNAVNDWIRTSGAFDAVVDWDADVRDPANPERLHPSYQVDYLHPNVAGYAVMGGAVPLSLFE